MDAGWFTSLEGMHVDGEKQRSEEVGHMFIFIFSFSVGNMKSLIYNVMTFTLCFTRRSVMSFLCCLYFYLFFVCLNLKMFFNTPTCELVVLSTTQKISPLYFFQTCIYNFFLINLYNQTLFHHWLSKLHALHFTGKCKAHSTNFGLVAQ